MVEPRVAETVFLDEEFLTPRPAGETRLSLDPTPETPPVRWWAGEGTLHFEGFLWSGAQMPDGMLMDVGAVDDVGNFSRSPVRVRLALSGDAYRRLATIGDLGPLYVEIGWIFSLDYGASWHRIDRYERGILGQADLAPGMLTGVVEGYEHDVDRGRPLTWSARTHPDYEMADRLTDGGIPFNWPLFEPRSR